MSDVLILDYNGVVVDDEPIHFAVLRDLLAVERIAMDRAAYYADYLGFDDRACLREAFRRAGRPLEPARWTRWRSARPPGTPRRSGPGHRWCRASATSCAPPRPARRWRS